MTEWKPIQREVVLHAFTGLENNLNADIYLSRLVPLRDGEGKPMGRVMVEVKGIDPKGRTLFHLRLVSRAKTARIVEEGHPESFTPERAVQLWKLRGVNPADLESREELRARERDFAAWLGYDATRF